MSKKRKTFLHRISDLTRIHHRAAFADVQQRISEHQGETPFLTLARNRYSCRSFSDKALTAKEINSLLEAARVAPTAANRQPVHIWAICSEEGLARIRAVHPTFGAPAVLMIGVKPEAAWVRSYDGKNEAATDAAITGTHLILQAADLGLGSVWIGAFDPVKVREAFPETEGFEITALFAVGHPSADASPNPRHTERQPMESFATKL